MPRCTLVQQRYTWNPLVKLERITRTEALQPVVTDKHVTNAEALYLIEGAGQVGLGLSWGDGYAYHQALLDTGRYISNPSDFFRTLVRSAFPAAHNERPKNPKP